MKVALLGTGIMGAGMARNIVAAGHELTVWNRSREKAEAVEGATVADSPADAWRRADALVTMLADGPAVDAAIGDLSGFGGVWLQMSTIGVEWTERLASRYSPFVDAPVLGSRQPAWDGELTVLASGPREPCASEIFDAVGTKTIWVGEEPGAATRMKLVFNALVILSLATIGQTLRVAAQLGVDANAFLDAVKGTGIDSPYTQLRGRAMANGDFAPNFALELARKDLALALDAVGGDAPLLEAALDAYDRAIAAGHGRDDMAAVITGIEQPGP
jgi:3-hydroxyisobutyrate dehydrogenase